MDDDSRHSRHGIVDQAAAIPAASQAATETAAGASVTTGDRPSSINDNVGSPSATSIARDNQQNPSSFTSLSAFRMPGSSSSHNQSLSASSSSPSTSSNNATTTAATTAARRHPSHSSSLSNVTNYYGEEEEEEEEEEVGNDDDDDNNKAVEYSDIALDNNDGTDVPRVAAAPAQLDPVMGEQVASGTFSRPVESMTRSTTGLPLALSVANSTSQSINQEEADTSSTVPNTASSSSATSRARTPNSIPTGVIATTGEAVRTQQRTPINAPPISSGIAQQRLAATAALEGNANTAPSIFNSMPSSPAGSDTPQDAILPSGPAMSPFVTTRRSHAPSFGAYSPASTSSLASSSPPASYTSSSNPLSRGGSGAVLGGAQSSTGTGSSNAASSPPTSVGTGFGGGGGYDFKSAGLHSRQNSHGVMSSGGSNLGIGISNSGTGAGTSSRQQSSSSSSSSSRQASASASTALSPPLAGAETTSLSSSFTGPVMSPLSSPGLTGPSSLPPLTSMSLVTIGAPTSSSTSPASSSSSPIGVSVGGSTTTAQNRLSTTPFLPSPLAQASLAPGEEEGEHMEALGLDAMLANEEKSSPVASASQLPALMTNRERMGRPLEASASAVYGSANVSSPTVLRRSSSVSQAGYKASSSRRRISSISQQQQQYMPTSTMLGLGQASPAGNASTPFPVALVSPPHAPTSLISPTGSVTSPLGSSLPNPIGAVAAAASLRPGSPSPLRQEASLLSRSREATSATSSSTTSSAQQSKKTPSSPDQPDSGLSRATSDYSRQSSSASLDASSIIRLTKQSSVGIQPSGSKASLASLAGSSGGGPGVSPTASTSGSSPNEYRFPPGSSRARQTSVSSAGSSASAASAPPRTLARNISPGFSSGTLDQLETAKSLSPPALSPLAMSASSPGLTYTLPASHRSTSVASHSRGTHGRSESLSSALGVTGMYHAGSLSATSGSSAASMSTSPSTAFRQFPSAPPVATPSLLSSSFNFSPSSAVSGGFSPPGVAPIVAMGISPSSSFSSSVGSRAETLPNVAPAAASGAGGIKLQRVPTSVRLAQELHPVSPILEKRRLSADPGSSSPSMGAGEGGSLSAFKIGGSEGTTSSSSNSSSSETEHRVHGEHTQRLGLGLPATPMATRRNTPSPSALPDTTQGEASANSVDRSHHPRIVPTSATGLASPFNVNNMPGLAHAQSPTSSLTNTSPTTSMRSLSIPTPPMQSTSAYAPLFPFSLPRSSARGSLADKAISSSPPGSRSHSVGRSKGSDSPTLNRRSPRLQGESFGTSAESPSTSLVHTHAETPSPRSSAFPNPLGGIGIAQSTLGKRNTISGLAPSLSSSSLGPAKPSSSIETAGGPLSPPSLITNIAAHSARTSPTSIRKHFRTSMMPGSISTTSTEDYARHLQESRASKLRKWATGSAPGTEEHPGEYAGAGNTFGAASDVQSNSKGKRRAGIPDFSGFGFAAGGPTDTGISQDYRDNLAGDLGFRPGTAGSREIEWVDWLDEYKKMKEAKIKAEQESQRHQALGNVDESAEAEGDDIALEMETPATHGRRGSQDYASIDGQSRRGSGDRSDAPMPFPVSRGSEDSADLSTGLPPRPRRLSTASLASLGMLEAAKRKRSSQESIGGSARPAMPVPAQSRKPLGTRSFSYAPPSSYAATRQEDTQSSGFVQPKKRKNIASKIDAWWSAVTKSFSANTDDKKSPPPPPPPMSRASPAAKSGQLAPLTTDRLMPAVSIDPADLPGRTSAQYARDAPQLGPPQPTLRHTASASDLTPEKRTFGAIVPPTGALAPAAKVPMHLPEYHTRMNSAGSEGDGSSGSGSVSKSEFRRRNPHLSLRLDPRFQPAGTVHRLSEKPASHKSSASQSSHSGPNSQGSPALFKEPRPPAAARLVEQTPSLTPGQSPIWDKTPGLVPLSQSQALRLSRSASRSSAVQKNASSSAAPLAPNFSISHIREHIKHRLSGAKHNCDKELKKIIHGITNYVENELETERAFASGLVSRQEEETMHDSRMIDSPLPASQGHTETDTGNDAEDELEPSSFPGSRPGILRADTSGSSSTGQSHSHTQSGVASPTAVLPQSGHRYSPQGLPATRGRTSGRASPRRVSIQSKRPQLGMPVKPADLAARLERSLDLNADDKQFGASRISSRSTSRSRSPMPFQAGGTAPARTSSAEWFRKHNVQEDEDKRNFLHSLQTVVAIAMEIVDTSVGDLTDDPSTCAQLIRRVQHVGQKWDDHPNWPVRGWYVSLLLAVAGLSRVAEFWAEERGFWNFEDEKGDDENEPILFVAKAGAQEDESGGMLRSRSRAPSTVLGLGRAPSRNDDKASTVSSPLGADLGIHRVEEEAAADTTMTVTGPLTIQEPEEPQVDEAEVLREAVEEVRSATILMELALDGESFQYLSPVWEDVVGLPPSVCLGRPISHLLFPEDSAVFAEASKHLQRDDSHTIEAHFRLRVFAENEDPDDHAHETFEAMEGKGMLIRDRLHGDASHTMWVIRPVAPQGPGSEDGEATTVRPQTATYLKPFSEPITPFPTAEGSRLRTQPILCRICDRNIPTWFFEKHNDTCNETHRLEVDVSDTNDKLSDLRGTMTDLLDGLKRTSGDSEEALQSSLSYRDIILLPQRYRDLQIRFVEELLQTISIASSVSTPALADEQMPIESQRLLSPNSEGHLSFLHSWRPNTSEDPALRQLADDLYDLCRQKLVVVNRLRNTILYVERIRLEWEIQAHALLSDQPSSESPPPSPAPTVLPSHQARHSIVTLSGKDFGTEATPTPASDEKFKSPNLPLPSQNPLSTISSPASMSMNSPAGLLDPLPMFDAALPGTDELSPAALALTKSPMLVPVSPRIPSTAPVKNAKAATSIKDFDIIKPISKGAFGSVYLAKKRNTGDYYAIKVLKKSDMIAKNQVTNVKAERKILMTQADSDFAVKLYWTFQSKDYLYLVMEYLNGGDCAALIKVMGCLDETWAKSYIAEIVLGLEYLHSRGIVHRDLKPDNLLIDSRGHLRLTDFGLSRFGLLGRHSQMNPPGVSKLSRRLQKRNLSKAFPQSASELSTPDSQPRASYFGSIALDETDTVSDSSGSESVHDRKPKLSSHHSRSPAISMDSNPAKLLPSAPSPGKTSETHRFVGTVDYVAPESITGIGVDECVDWWALGVICHEFLTAYPPFHDETPERVFENIVSRRINWHEDEVEMSPEARDFINRLLCNEPTRRLGAKGADEVKRHPFLRDIDWAQLRTTEANFVPQVADPESTDYFDARGATAQAFEDEILVAPTTRPSLEDKRMPSDPATGIVLPDLQQIEEGDSETNDFGTFNFKNLDVLKQANDDVIRKLRSDQLIPPAVEMTAAASALASIRHQMKRASNADQNVGQPPSPSTSTTSSIGSGFSRPSGPTTPFPMQPSHKRRPSNQGVPRLKAHMLEGQEEDSSARRNSLPGRMRRASFSITGKHQAESAAHQRRRTSGYTEHTPASSVSSPTSRMIALPSLPGELAGGSAASSPHKSEKTVDCLIAEDNPISSKILETILVRLGCLCVVVHNGEEAIRCSMGEIAFDVIFMDMLMPILDGENAARMIKSTKNANQNTPIVAVTSYAAHERTHITEEGTLFNAVLTKPVSKPDVLNVLTKLGFVAKAKPAVSKAVESPAAVVDSPGLA